MEGIHSNPYKREILKEIVGGVCVVLVGAIGGRFSKHRYVVQFAIFSLPLTRSTSSVSFLISTSVDMLLLRRCCADVIFDDVAVAD